jgi:hypothetical protein
MTKKAVKKTAAKKPAAKKAVAKKTAVKKPAVKKPAAKKTAPVKKDPKREILVNELRTLIPKLDIHGLAFLVKQSRVHIYNMQVDELNKAARSANLSAARSKKITASVEKTEKAKKETIRIVATSSGSGYYLYYQNSNVVFSRVEMVSLVKIVNGEGTTLEVAERLYSWFLRERKDVFALVPIEDKYDVKLKSIAALIKKNFKLKIK